MVLVLVLMLVVQHRDELKTLHIVIVWSNCENAYWYKLLDYRKGEFGTRDGR